MIALFAVCVAKHFTAIDLRAGRLCPNDFRLQL